MSEQKIFKDRETLIDEQIEASRNIKHNFGIEKALGYIMGEKLYALVEEYECWLRNHPGQIETTSTLQALIIKISEQINRTYSQEEINRYFESNPRFGPLGHVLTEDEHELFVEQGVVDHTIDVEITDALIAGEMKRYLKIR